MLKETQKVVLKPLKQRMHKKALKTKKRTQQAGTKQKSCPWQSAKASNETKQKTLNGAQNERNLRNVPTCSEAIWKN